MQTATRGSLRAIAGQLAVIAGVLHLGLGMYYTVGGPGTVADDVRVVLWAVAGAVLVGGVAVAAVGWRRDLLYKVGIVLVVVLLGAHFAWPMIGPGTFYVGPAPGFEQGMGSYLVAMVLGVQPLAKVVLAVEVVLLAMLLVLLADPDRA